MKDLKTITALVHYFLETNKQTRNSDSYLYFKVITHIADKHNICLKDVTVLDFLLNMRQSVFPPFESVRRTRQKLQEHNPGLAACPEVEEGRLANEAAYLEFARGAV